MDTQRKKYKIKKTKLKDKIEKKKWAIIMPTYKLYYFTIGFVMFISQTVFYNTILLLHNTVFVLSVDNFGNCNFKVFFLNFAVFNCTCNCLYCSF